MDLWSEEKLIKLAPSTLQRVQPDSGLLITTTNLSQSSTNNVSQDQSYSEENSSNERDPPSTLGNLTDQQRLQQYSISRTLNPDNIQQITVKLKFKNLITHYQDYITFLHVVQDKYQTIMNQCAMKISKHFTDITSVINEGNSYEFPSPELHKAIINKLILNDQQHFKSFFLSIKKKFKENEEVIMKQIP